MMPDTKVRLSIRYCGGCNPVVDRGELALSIKARLPETGIDWELVDEMTGEKPDVRLVISGCVRDCTTRPDNTPEVVVAGFRVNLFDVPDEEQVVGRALTALAEKGRQIKPN